jgi:hypothetical protein
MARRRRGGRPVRPLANLPGLIATGQILGAATIIGAQHVLLARRA